MRLPQRFAEHDGSGNGNVQRSETGSHRYGDACIGLVVDGIGNTGAFAAKQQRIVRRESEAAMRRCRLRCEKDETSRRFGGSASCSREGVEAHVPCEIDERQVIERGAFQRAIAHVEAGRADDVDGHAKAGPEAKYRSGVLSNVGLIEGEAHPGCLRDLGDSCLVRHLRQIAPHFLSRFPIDSGIKRCQNIQPGKK